MGLRIFGIEEILDVESGWATMTARVSIGLLTFRS
jgi:hypothetical protein